MRKIILVLLGCCMFGCVSVMAQNFEYEGLQYTVLTDSTAAVAYGNYNVKGDVVIPDSVSCDGKWLAVTAIADNAFGVWSFVDGITSVQFPKGLTSIGSNAFSYQRSLRTIDIPETVEYIGGGALSFTGLKTFTMKHAPKEMQYGVFSYCDSLEQAIIPDGMKVLPEYTFNACKNLKEIVLPHLMTTIAYNAFLNCTALESFTLPDSLKVLEGDALGGCTNLKEIHWNSVIESIGDYLFERCERLEEIALPATLSMIPNGCFRQCSSLRRVTIPTSVTTIGSNAFQSCTALEEINWDGGSINSIADGTFKGCKSLKHMDIPESVTRIGANAFEGSGLLSVVLGPNLERLGYESFKGCSSLEDVYLRTDKLDEMSRWNNYFPSVAFYLGTLHVPEGQKNKFLHLDYWKQFQNIVEENVSGTEYCLIDVKTNGYNTYVNDEEIMLETHLEQPKGSSLAVRFTFNKNMFGDGVTRYLRGMQVNGVERLQDCTNGTLIIDEVMEDLDITVDIGFYGASLVIYQDERGGLEVLCAPDVETNATIIPAEGYRAKISYGPWMETYQWSNPWKETYTASDNQPFNLPMWLREDVEIKVKYEKK